MTKYDPSCKVVVVTVFISFAVVLAFAVYGITALIKAAGSTETVTVLVLQIDTINDDTTINAEYETGESETMKLGKGLSVDDLEPGVMYTLKVRYSDRQIPEILKARRVG